MLEIEIKGRIGSGKSTAVEMIKRIFISAGVPVSIENFDEKSSKCITLSDTELENQIQNVPGIKIKTVQLKREEIKIN